MSKELEVNLKKVELKVSVHCCDGCKKRVRKVLQSIEGVFKTDIDPLQPKVTILGNVDPQTLIKKLLKAGKQAELMLWSYDENQNAAGTVKKREGEKSKSAGCNEAKWSDAVSTVKIKDINSGDGDSTVIKVSKKKDDTDQCIANTHVTKNENHHPEPEVNCNITHPSMMQHDTSKVRPHQYCHMVEPCCTITLPYYAVHSYKVPGLAPISYCPEHYYHESPMSQPPVHIPAPRVGDYFSDENTDGCHVM